MQPPSPPPQKKKEEENAKFFFSVIDVWKTSWPTCWTNSNIIHDLDFHIYTHTFEYKLKNEQKQKQKPRERQKERERESEGERERQRERGRKRESEREGKREREGGKEGKRVREREGWKEREHLHGDSPIGSIFLSSSGLAALNALNNISGHSWHCFIMVKRCISPIWRFMLSMSSLSMSSMTPFVIKWSKISCSSPGVINLMISPSRQWIRKV